MQQGQISHALFEVNDGASSGLGVKTNYNLTKCLKRKSTSVNPLRSESCVNSFGSLWFLQSSIGAGSYDGRFL